MLLNPKSLDRVYADLRSAGIMKETVSFFESKGKQRLKEDDRQRIWYRDFLDFQKSQRVFATLLTPAAYGQADCRWDTWRNCEFNEILAFYGLPYWYTWQVSILGLGPIWMSDNEALKRKAARLLEEGAVFAFGLSERQHGADLYATEMALTPQGDGTYRAHGEKYYIGNGNEASMVSTFGKIAGTDEYVFFAADYRDPRYRLLKNVCDSQSYVANFALQDYPITDADVLSRGQAAWDAALNTVNVGKYNLGWASIGICTHAFYEAIRHASRRRLYGMYVTDYPHVKQMFVDAYTRLLAMKLFALRAADYLRSASLQDRRYLLYNPVVKMKVTTQGEEVINLLWDVIAAKGFEKDMYFEMAARDIRALPKLEGTVHVNIALIVKFMANYFLRPASFPEIGTRNEPADDAFLFQQGPTGGLGKVQFHDYAIALGSLDLPNVRLFRQQTATLREMLAALPADEGQQRDTDYLLALGELFTLVVYAQLFVENARIYRVDEAVIDQTFDFLVRDFSRFAVQLLGKPATTSQQAAFCLKMVQKPISDSSRFHRVWEEHVHPLQDAYEMNP